MAEWPFGCHLPCCPTWTWGHGPVWWHTLVPSVWRWRCLLRLTLFCQAAHRVCDGRNNEIDQWWSTARHIKNVCSWFTCALLAHLEMCSWNSWHLLKPLEMILKCAANSWNAWISSWNTWNTWNKSRLDEWFAGPCRCLFLLCCAWLLQRHVCGTGSLASRPPTSSPTTPSAFLFFSWG